MTATRHEQQYNDSNVSDGPDMILFAGFYRVLSFAITERSPSDHRAITTLEGSPITTPTTGDQITGAEHHSEHRLNTKPNTVQIRTIRRSPNPNTASEHKNSLITAQRMPNTGRTQAV